MFGTGVTDAQGNARAVPILKSLPIWQFQGDQDTQVNVVTVRAEVDAFKLAGSPILYSEHKGGDHAIWDGVYGRADVWAWLWAQHR